MENMESETEYVLVDMTYKTIVSFSEMENAFQKIL